MNECSKPSLGCNVAAIIYQAVCLIFHRWTWCRRALFWKVALFYFVGLLHLTGRNTCFALWNFWPSHFSGFMGDKVCLHVVDGVSLPAFLWGRQSRCWKMSTRSRNSEFLVNLGSMSYSLHTSSQPWHGTRMTIGINLHRQKQMVAPYLTIFGLCSRIEKNLVVTYSRSQSCTSRAHVWCHLDHGRWFTVNVTFFQLRFWGKDTQAAEDSVPPKWKRVFVSSTDRATKEFSERIATYSMLNRLNYVQLS